MVTIKSLLSYLVEYDGKRVIFFFDQENQEIISQESIDEEVKKEIKEQILSEIYGQKIVQPDFGTDLIDEVNSKLNDIKEQHHDSGKHEL